MKNEEQYQRNRKINSLLTLGAGALLVAFSFFAKSQASLVDYYKLIQGIGIFLLLWGVMMFVRAYLNRKNPTAMKKEMIDNLDERKTWIRYRSGYNAFIVVVAFTYVALLVVGMTTTAINPDLAWWVLAGIVVVTLAVFIISLVVYESKY